MSLQTACEAIAAVCRGVSGVRFAPDYAPESADIFPFVVTFPASGSWVPSAGFATVLHDISVQVHVARKDLPNDLVSVMPYADLIPAALLADTTLGGAVQTFSELRYEFKPMNWNGIDTLGFEFTLVGVKLQPTL